MPAWHQVRHQVAIAGRVTDTQTGQAIGQARVEIGAGPAAFTGWLAGQAMQYGERWAAMAERPDRTHTAPDGHFHFLDLPPGRYTLTASRPGAGSRCGQAQKKVTVRAPAADGKIALVAADLALPPTTVKGRVTQQGTTRPLVLAEVQVQGSGERTFTDGQGQYMLTGLEASAGRARTLRVSAQGYQPATQTVLLDKPGAERMLNFGLALATP